MGGTSRTETTYVIYKFKLQKVRLQNLHYNHKDPYAKTLDAIIDEKKSVATKNRIILHTFSTIRHVIDVSYKSNLALISLNFREHFTE